MATADVARLRFVLSADSGGLKSGCKDASGSLKDMESDFRKVNQKMDADGLDWKGLRKSARSLRFVGREMGGMVKGGIGDVIGLATMGAGLGPMGAAVAAGAIGVHLYQSHQEQLEKDRAKAYNDFQGARKAGIDPGVYRELSSIAGEDAKFLDDMTGAMKRLQQEGPNASAALKQLGADIGNYAKMMGLKGEKGEEVKQKQLSLAGEKMLGDVGERREFFGSDQAGVMESHIVEKLKGGGMGDAEAKAKAAERMNKFSGYGLFGTRELGPAWGRTQDQERAYQKEMSEFSKDALDAKAKIEKEAERLNRGPAPMAGAEAYGSVGAYSVIANAQMAAQATGANPTDRTNEILEQQFPEAIRAIKQLNPTWKLATSPS